MHGDVFVWYTKSICETLWEIGEDLSDCDRIGNNKRIVERVRKANLNQGRIWRFVRKTSFGSDDFR